VGTSLSLIVAKSLYHLTSEITCAAARPVFSAPHASRVRWTRFRCRDTRAQPCQCPRIGSLPNHKNRAKCEVKFIDKPCAEILLNRCNSPADSYVPAVCSLFRTLQCRMNPVRDKVKGCAALHFDRLARVVRQHECRNMIGRFVTPPSFPGVVRPRTAHRSKHVPAENPGPDVVHASLCPFVIDTRSAAFMALHLLPCARGEEPFEQLWATNAKRIVETLVRSRGVTIQRYRKGADANFGHDLNLRARDADGQTRLHLDRASEWIVVSSDTMRQRVNSRKIAISRNIKRRPLLR
jgi:hypothetical protein